MIQADIITLLLLPAPLFDHMERGESGESETTANNSRANANNHTATCYMQKTQIL